MSRAYTQMLRAELIQSLRALPPGCDNSPPPPGAGARALQVSGSLFPSMRNEELWMLSFEEHGAPSTGLPEESQ